MGEINFEYQALTLLFSVLAGMICGGVYILFSSIRRMFNKSKIVVFILDVLFFVFAAFFTFCIMLLRSLGNIRVFILLGESIGFFIILKTVYKPILRLIEKISAAIFNLMLNIIKLAKKYLKPPLGLLYNFIVLRCFKKSRKNEIKSGNEEKA